MLATYYYPIMGLAIGLSLTTTLFMLVTRAKINFPGREGVAIWSVGLGLAVVTQSAIAITRHQPLFLRDVLLFVMTYAFLHCFGRGFMILHGLPLPRYVIRTGALLTIAYAAVLQVDSRFWVRAIAANVMQAGVAFYILLHVMRFYFQTEKARLSAVLTMMGAILGVAGSLMRAQGAFEQQDEFMRLVADRPLDGTRQYFLTLLALTFSTLAMLQGCFERVVDQARLAETFHPLTGLLNPRRLKANGEREVALAREERRGLAVALVKIDAFKQIRLLRGEEAARNAMQALAQALVPDMRLVDLAGHFYEDVLCLVAPGEEAPLALGDMCLRRIRARVEAGKLDFTASVGVAALPANDTQCGWRELAWQADRALAAASEQGGDRFVLYAGNDLFSQDAQPLRSA